MKEESLFLPADRVMTGIMRFWVDIHLTSSSRWETELFLTENTQKQRYQLKQFFKNTAEKMGDLHGTLQHWSQNSHLFWTIFPMLQATVQDFKRSRERSLELSWKTERRFYGSEVSVSPKTSSLCKNLWYADQQTCFQQFTFVTGRHGNENSV